MIGYRIRNKQDLNIFYRRFKCKYDVREWSFTYASTPIFYVTGGVMQNWGLERDKVRDVPIYELCQFNDYYEEIFYNKK